MKTRKFGKGALSKSETSWNDGILEYRVLKPEKVVLLVQERFAEAQGREFLAFSLKYAAGGRSSNLFQGNTYPSTHHSSIPLFQYSG